MYGTYPCTHTVVWQRERERTQCIFAERSTRLLLSPAESPQQVSCAYKRLGVSSCWLCASKECRAAQLGTRPELVSARRATVWQLAAVQNGMKHRKTGVLCVRTPSEREAASQSAVSLHFAFGICSVYVRSLCGEGERLSV